MRAMRTVSSAYYTSVSGCDNEYAPRGVGEHVLKKGVEIGCRSGEDNNEEVGTE